MYLFVKLLLFSTTDNHTRLFFQPRPCSYANQPHRNETKSRGILLSFLISHGYSASENKRHKLQRFLYTWIFQKGNNVCLFVYFSGEFRQNFAGSSLDVFIFLGILPWDPSPFFTTILDHMFGTCSKHLMEVQATKVHLLVCPRRLVNG